MASPVVAGLRKQYPGYDDIPDEDFVQAVHDVHYKDLSDEDYLHAVDDLYTPKSPMKPQTHWADNVVHALGDAARSLPGEMLNDAMGVFHGTMTRAGATALERQNQSLPSETPEQLRARGYTPKQVHAVLQGNSDIQQQETSALQEAARHATSDQARGAAFLATLPIGVEGLAGKQLAGRAGLKILQNGVVKHAITGAAAVGGYQGIRTGLEEGPAAVPKAVGEGAVMGAIAAPIFGRSLEAVGSVLSIPKNIIAGFNEASGRIAAQNAAAGRAATLSFVNKWAARFNADNIRNFPEIHNALANGKVDPPGAARLLINSLRSSRPGGFLDDAMLDDPAVMDQVTQEVGGKLGKWWLRQPSARLQLRTLPRPVDPAIEVSGNNILNTAAPEPNVVDLPTPEAPAPAPVEAMPVEGNTPPAPAPMAMEGVAPTEGAPTNFQTPQALSQPLGLPGDNMEPNPAGMLGTELQGAAQQVAPGTPTPEPVQAPSFVDTNVYPPSPAVEPQPPLELRGVEPEPQISTERLPSPAANDMVRYMNQKYPAVDIATASSNPEPTAYWLGPNGALYAVPDHGTSSAEALKAARIGVKSVGYKGAHTWSNHGMLQHGFIRVQMEPGQIGIEAVTNANPLQRAIIARLQKERSLVGVVSSSHGGRMHSTDSWSAYRRLLNEHGAQ